MKATINWIQEHLSTHLNATQILEKLEDLGFEVKNLYSYPNLWKQVRIVKILEKKKHQSADKLNLYTIQKKTGETLTVVCGDPTLEPGDHVPYAMPGCTMPSGLVLKVSKIRGIDSPGMLCSADDLGLPIECHGVLKGFEEDFGKSIAEAYESEAVFELELTPNRGDALSILGLARILANSNYGDLKEKHIDVFKVPEDEYFKINSKDCQGLICSLFQYSAKQTPAKIIKRLQLTGHSILNIDIVDLTNYISHDIGQPMHVFDYDKIQYQECKIENLAEEQEFRTLADQNIKLKKNTLVMKSGKEIISWPGIIGGYNSKVDHQTKTVLLETGVFTIDSMQRRQNGIVTSAAKKIEYGIDPFALEKATFQYFSLLGTRPMSQQKMLFQEKKRITFNFNKIKEILGETIDQESFKTIMKRKDFLFNEDNTVTPPTYKFFDINTENCIIEEFAIDKYEQLKSLNLSPKYPKRTINKCKVSKIALGCGFNECKNISLGKRESIHFGFTLTNREVVNYSNTNYSILRASLIPDLLKNYSWHIKNQRKQSKFFEVGLIYGDYPSKQRKIFTAISPKLQHLQELLSKTLSTAGLYKKILLKKESLSYSENSQSFFINETKIGSLASIKDKILKEFDLKECYALEIFPEALEEKPEQQHKEINDLCPIYQDVTFKIAPEMSVAAITNILNKEDVDYKIVTIYPSNNLHEQRKVTIQFKIEPEKILTKEEINLRITRIQNRINSILNPESF